MLHRYPPEEGGELGWGSELFTTSATIDGPGGELEFVPEFFRPPAPAAPDFPPFRLMLFRPQGELLKITHRGWREDRERLPKEVDRLLTENGVDPNVASWE